MYVSCSQVKYKSDLNWLRGIGWTPPGSHKVEMARRAAELAYMREMGLQGASALYGPGVVSRVHRSSHKSQQLCSLEVHASCLMLLNAPWSLQFSPLFEQNIYTSLTKLCVHLNLK